MQGALDGRAHLARAILDMGALTPREGHTGGDLLQSARRAWAFGDSTDVTFVNPTG